MLIYIINIHIYIVLTICLYKLGSKNRKPDQVLYKSAEIPEIDK